MQVATEEASMYVEEQGIGTRIPCNREQQRHAEYECKACFYLGRIAGRAMTHRECMSCKKDVIYPSTATGVLCLPCARDFELCRRCGGDIEINLLRTSWPKAYHA